MNRMLDAGEHLFYEGGSTALTLESVIERAETSTGSFYARFGDMQGFLHAMHERVHQMLSAELLPIFDKAAREPDLKSSLHKTFTGFFDVIERHRIPLYFFVVDNAHDSEWRETGAQFTIGFSDVFISLVKQYLPKFTSTHDKRRIEMATRMSIAAVFQQIMLDQNEFSRVTMSRKAIATEYANMVYSYLTASPSQ
jgi:AcrR family transcriptional regulator